MPDFNMSLPPGMAPFSGSSPMGQNIVFDARSGQYMVQEPDGSFRPAAEHEAPAWYRPSPLEEQEGQLVDTRSAPQSIPERYGDYRPPMTVMPGADPYYEAMMEQQGPKVDIGEAVLDPRVQIGEAQMRSPLQVQIGQAQMRGGR